MEQSQETVKVTIFVNGSEFTFDTRNVKGIDIKAKAGLDANSDLFRKEGEKLTPIANDEEITIHDGERFVDFPPTPVS
jgi:hypothetical protein